MPDMIQVAKKVQPPMGAKLLAPTEGWWPWPPNGGLQATWLVKLKFGALCTSSSGSCGGMVALSHLIGALYDGKKKGRGVMGRGGILLHKI